jgi:DNA-binding NarL/FixJ family response regulator
MKFPILVVEDELITANSIIELLEDEDFCVLGPAKNAAEAIAFCEKSQEPPAVALCDINIKGPVNGTELAFELRKRYNTEVIFLTAYTDASTLSAAFETNPVMYLVKPYTDSQLLVAIQMAMHKILQKQKDRHFDSLYLTEREKEIATLVSEGLSSKQIASRLSISMETVKTHRRRMLQKNNLNSFPQLVFRMRSNQ